MDKQQEQTNQNSNQEVEYISGFLDEDEEVNESEFDEPTGEQEVGKLGDNQQNKPEGEEQTKKPKRPRKTIEQEIAELDAKRERLMEKKRKQDAHEKIIFGTTIIAMLKEMKKKSDKDYSIIYDSILRYMDKNSIKDKEIFKNILSSI